MFIYQSILIHKHNYAILLEMIQKEEEWKYF